MTLEALVNPFEGITDFESPDNVKKIELEPTGDLAEKAVSRWDAFQNKEGVIHEMFDEYNERRVENGINPVSPDWEKIIGYESKDAFTPVQIDVALQGMLQRNYDPYRICQVLQYLLVTSYAAGHNEFGLHINDADVLASDAYSSRTGVCAFLKGTKKNPISINIYGNSFQGFAFGSEYCNYHMHGDLNRDNMFHVNNCNFVVEGDVLLEKDLICYVPVKSSVFRIKREDVYEKMKPVVAKWNNEISCRYSWRQTRKWRNTLLLEK